jgi:hypothetical protein
MAKRKSKIKKSKAKQHEPQSLLSEQPPNFVVLELQSLPKLVNPTLLPVWVDLVDITSRPDIGVATLRFYAFMKDTNDYLVEVARIQTPMAHLKSMSEVFTRLASAPVPTIPEQALAAKT